MKANTGSITRTSTPTWPYIAVGVRGALGNEQTARRRWHLICGAFVQQQRRRLGSCKLRVCARVLRAGACFPNRLATSLSATRRLGASWFVRWATSRRLPLRQQPTWHGSVAMLRAAGAPSFIDNPRPGAGRYVTRQYQWKTLVEYVSTAYQTQLWNEPSLVSSHGDTRGWRFEKLACFFTTNCDSSATSAMAPRARKQDRISWAPSLRKRGAKTSTREYPTQHIFP